MTRRSSPYRTRLTAEERRLPATAFTSATAAPSGSSPAISRRRRGRRSCSSAATSDDPEPEPAHAVVALGFARCRASTRPSSSWSATRRSCGSKARRRRARTDPRQARVPQPGRLGEGPHRPRDDRGGRARREAQAGRDDRRADLGQHRRRPRDRGGRQGLPLHLRDAGQDEPGEDLDAARLRRRGRDHADRRRARLAGVVLLRLVAARRGDPRRLQARPVLEHGEPAGALRGHRRRRSGEQTGGEIDAIVISVGTGGTISGVGRYFKEHAPDVQIVGADPEGSVYTAGTSPTSIRISSRGSARTRGPRRWTRGRRRVDPRLRPRLVPDGAAARARGGPARRRLRRARRSGPRSRSRSGSGRGRRS